MATKEESKKSLVYSILQFLDDEVKSGAVKEDGAESLEVVTQCLESVYGISLQDPQCVAKYRRQESLLELMDRLSLGRREVSKEDKVEAEKSKVAGNELMKDGKFEEAAKEYNKSVERDPYNAVYYCNRAAAYGKMEDHVGSLADCEEALRLDPQYSKAYGRMGLALSALEQHDQAIECYKKALELDPGNDSYKGNLDIAQQKMADMAAQGTTGGNPMGAMGGLGGLSGILQNPAFMNMAQQMMSSPQMQNMMSSVMTGAQQSDQGQDVMRNLMQAGQQLAQQMQQSNPELVNELQQQQMGPPGSDGPPSEDPPAGDQPPPPPPSDGANPS